MSRSPHFDDIFAVMAQASVGRADARVDVPEDAPVEDLATRFAIALNLLLDDLALRSDELALKLHTIERQQAEILELSTPILALDDSTLLLPLIGPLDPARGRQMNQAILEAVRRARARTVVIDLTAVPEIDPFAAAALRNTAVAARLMGAATVIAGIRAEVAAGMVASGIDLTGSEVVADLRTGLDSAKRRRRA